MNWRIHHHAFRHRGGDASAGYRHAVARAERIASEYLPCQRKKAVTMGVSFIPGVNVIDVGHALEAKLNQMSRKNGRIRIDLFYDQAAEVGHSLTVLLLTS